MLHCRFHDKIDLSFSLKFYFILFWKGGYKGRGWIQRDGKMNEMEMYDLKVTKNKLKMHLQIELHYLRHIIYFKYL